MRVVQDVLEHAEQQCKAHGTRLSDKRKQVLMGLLESDKALSAYELVDYCKDTFGYAIPAMSVYRILDFLQSERLVHKLNLANKYVACAHITCGHDHEASQFLICNQCQCVSEVSISKLSIREIKSSVEKAGFRLIDPQLEMNCICENCLENRI